MLAYFAMFAIAVVIGTVRLAPLNHIFPELPGWFNIYIFWNLPGLVLAALVFIGKAERKYVIAGLAVVVSGLVFWNVMAVEPFPVPVETYHDFARRGRFQLCGVYQLKLGHNIIDYNATLDKNIQCYLLFLRPDPRNQIVTVSQNSWIKVQVVRENSTTNSFLFNGWMTPAGTTFIWWIRTGEYRNTILVRYVDGWSDYTGYTFRAGGPTYRDDFIFWYWYSYPEENRPVTVSLTLHVELDVRGG